MINKKVVLGLSLLSLFIILYNPGSVYSEDYKDLGNPFLDLTLQPCMLIPLLKDRTLFYPGVGGFFSGEMKIPGIPYIHGRAESGFYYSPVKAKTPLYIISLGLGAEFKINIAPRLGTNSCLSSGYYLGILGRSPFNRDVDFGGNAYISAKLGSSYFLTPSLSLDFDLSYQNYFGLVQFLSLFFGVAYHIPAQGVQPLEIIDIEVDKLFPIMFQTYFEEPPGKFTVKNRSRFPVSDIEATFYMKPYMTHPTSWKIPISLDPGEEKELELRVLLGERILGILEGTKVSAELHITYDYAGKQHIFRKTVAVHLHDRNALTWDDDRKAALFVSEKDPTVLSFAGNTASVVKHSHYRPINTKFRMAAGLHSALSAYGLSYVIDPKSPYAEVKKDGLPVDFLRFPRQTLKHRAGDCDDLSVLYCALLESVGIEAAFITVPGHIFTAFSLEMTEEEALRTFISVDDLIMVKGVVWLPVETTEIKGGFLEAWRKGAKQWREYSEEGEARLYPIHEAWEKYSPISLPEGSVEITYPEDDRVADLYNEEVVNFINRELEPQVQKCLEKIKENNESPRAINLLGVLYARYGLYDQAERELKRIVNIKEYQPALVNLGNIYYQKGDFQMALEYYERAYRINEKKSRLLLHLAETNYKLGLYGKTEEYFQKLREIEPKLAGKFAYLVVRKDENRKAAERSTLERDMVWEEE